MLESKLVKEVTADTSDGVTMHSLNNGCERPSSHQFSSVTQSCPTLCDPMNRSTPGLPVMAPVFIPQKSAQHYQPGSLLGAAGSPAPFWISVSQVCLVGFVPLVCTCAQLLQSCLTLCDPMDCSPPGFSVHGISQARILKWVAISLSRGSS